MAPIKDSVHDHIPLDPVASAVIDTPPFQRLRHIKQLATVRLVYPSANHTRFEHSLGVYHLACVALRQFDVSARTAAHVRIAALLHDVGHGPFGHQTEAAIRRHAGTHHDEIRDLLGETELAALLEDHGLDPDRVAALVRGEGELGQLVSGKLDVDRMDYLVRDAHHVGVPYGTIDYTRLISQLESRDGALVVTDGTAQIAESLLIARSLMNGVVYGHHVSRIAGAMLDRASEAVLDAGVSIDAFRRMADRELLTAMLDAVPELGRRLEERDLYKRACWTGIDDVPAWTLDLSYDDVRQLEHEIADATGLDPLDVVVDVPEPPSIEESDVRVAVDGDVRRLEDVSSLVPALRDAERNRWRLGVYAPDAAIDEVKPVARRKIGLA